MTLDEYVAEKTLLWEKYKKADTRLFGDFEAQRVVYDDYMRALRELDRRYREEDIDVNRLVR